MGKKILQENELQEKFQKDFEAFKNSLATPNIMLLGQTGVGKSTLVNTIFGAELAKVSHTTSETRGFHRYCSTDNPINIIDSEGYELSNAENFATTFSKYIKDHASNINDQIHIVWYCISIANTRVLPYDIENISNLYNNHKIPTAVVFTQCDNDSPEGTIAKQLGEEIMKHFDDKIPYFQVSNNEEINKELEIKELIDWSINNLSSDNLKDAFIIAQKADLDKKYKAALKAASYFSASAAGVGAIPIPFSDASVLMPLQVAMTARIFLIFGIKVDATDVIKNLISSKFLSMLGRSLVGNILKFFPGIGSGVGAMINGAVASTITMSLGFAVANLSKKLIESKWNGDMNVFNTIFSDKNFDSMMDLYKSKNEKH